MHKFAFLNESIANDLHMVNILRVIFAYQVKDRTMKIYFRMMIISSLAALLLVGCGNKSETDKAAEAAGAAVTNIAKDTIEAAKVAVAKTEQASKDVAEATARATDETKEKAIVVKDKVVEAKDKAVDVVVAAKDAAKKEAAK